jgi:hypothetical protein
MIRVESRLNSGRVSPVDTFLTVAIMLVLVQTFLEELAIMAGWGVEIRRYLLIAGFAFDLLFSIEFLARFFTALSMREAGDYLLRRRGWVDFLAALPLLLFDSGPRIYVLAAGGGVVFGGAGALNVLKSVKAIRLARILRFLRALKLFRNIKNTDSPMAQRHLARIATLSLSTVVFTAILWGALSSSLNLPTPLGEAAAAQAAAVDRAGASGFSSLHEDLLMVKEGDKVLFSRYDNSYYESAFDLEDYRVENRGALTFFFDLRTARAVQSREQLSLFMIVIALLLVILFIYGPHFAATVSDPVHVMKRGMGEDDYGLEVEINPNFRGDDIYRLAALYNRRFLPMKARDRFDSGEGSSSLSMDDIGDFDFQEKS